jgi:hypothetical protein
MHTLTASTSQIQLLCTLHLQDDPIRNGYTPPPAAPANPLGTGGYPGARLCCLLGSLSALCNLNICCS